MARRKKKAEALVPARPQPAVPAPQPRGWRGWLSVALAGLVAIVVLAAFGLYEIQRNAHRSPPQPASTSSSPAPRSSASSTAAGTPATAPSAAMAPLAASFIGGETCGGCHATEMAAWKTSHHALAMQHATPETMLGDFANATFTKDGVTSTFFRRDGKFFVNTDGPEGRLADYELAFTFGIDPLQQYLADVGNGRFQALPIAWDTRPKADGGQRWFHLYPDQKIDFLNPLHWTGLQQNWNFMCAECHSTKLERNYDARTESFATTWSEVNVSCEACHGPGSNHVAWANGDRTQGSATASDKGLMVQLTERRDIFWELDPKTGNSRRSTPRTTSTELQTCARCHSRRGQIWDQTLPPAAIGDTHRIAVFDEGLYFPDGQIRDEVFEHGSFLQSRMAHEGVTCSDCHEPHSATLRAPGNGVCLQCHEAAKFDVAEHSHHPAGSPGSLCANCHMPQRTYMVVDPRRDHSLRIPRPDQSIALGTPNACTNCHADKDAVWAAAAVKDWFPSPHAPFQAYAEILDAGDREAPGAREKLIALAADKSQPGIARASALARLDNVPSREAYVVLRSLLSDPDPLVRRAASEVYSRLPLEARLDLFAMLPDPVRDVRLAAVLPLAALPAAQLSPEQTAAREKAIAEYVASQESNAERPEAHQNLGALYMALGQAGKAEAELKRAIALDPAFVPAAVTLADLYRATNRDSEGEAVLRAMIARLPNEAATHGALGLWLVRQGRGGEALAEFRLAYELGADDPRNAYVYAVALSSAGMRPQALAIIEAALALHPYHRDTLMAGVSFERDAGDLEAALRYAETLQQLEPGDRGIAELTRQLQAPQP